MESAVKKDSVNLEIRFLRFMMQCKIPKFLNYNNIAEDKYLLINDLSYFSKLDDLSFSMKVFECMLGTGLFSETEQALIRMYLK
jgi:hypothetical protein